MDTRLREVFDTSGKLLMQQYEADAGWESIKVNKKKEEIERGEAQMTYVIVLTIHISIKSAQTRVLRDWDQTWTHVNTSLITMLHDTGQEIQQLQQQVHDIREQIFTLVQSVQRASRRLMSFMSMFYTSIPCNRS